MTIHNNASPRRILIADLLPHQSAELRRMAEDAGYNVVAETTEDLETLHAAYCLRAELVLLSNDLPLRGGVETASLLIRRKTAPVVLLLDAPNTEVVRAAIAAGVQSILTRPIRHTSLVPALEMALNLWETIRKSEQRLERLQDKEQTREVVDCAKKILMGSGNMTEQRAYRFLQARSMATHRPIRTVAEAVIVAHHTVRKSAQGAALAGAHGARPSEAQRLRS